MSPADAAIDSIVLLVMLMAGVVIAIVRATAAAARPGPSPRALGPSGVAGPAPGEAGGCHPIQPALRRRFLEAISRCHWFTLERVVAALLREMGYPVEHRGGAAADGGADILARTSEGAVVVQVKKWESWKVSLRVVREVLGARVASGASGAWLVATARVTREAREFAARHGVRLIDPEEMADWLDAIPDPGPVLAIAEDPVPHCPLCRVPMVRRTARRGTNAGAQFWGCPRYPACRQIVREGP